MVAQSNKLMRSFHTKLSKAEGDRSIVARVSTATVDRDGEVVLPRGMKYEDFMKNPVMLLGHSSGSLPIGRWKSLDRKSSGIIAQGEFASRPPEHPPMAEWLPDTVLAMVRQEVIKGVSIGFIIEPDGAREASAKDLEQFGEGVRRVITGWKLVEISIVPIPANQDALITAVSKGMFGETMLSKIWDMPKKPKLIVDFPQLQCLTIDVLPALTVEAG